MPQALNAFTLVELLIVVAIIAILVAIALPLYQGYILKAAVGRVSAEVGALRTAFETCVLNGQLTPTSCDFGATGSNLQEPGGNTANGGPPVTGGAPVATMNPDGSGSLTATFGGNAPAILSAQDAKVIRSRDDAGNWTCRVTGVPLAAIPSGCQAGGL